MIDEQPAETVSAQSRWEDGTPKSLNNAFTLPILLPPESFEEEFRIRKNNGVMYKVFQTKQSKKALKS
jgi:hypothetical protein